MIVFVAKSEDIVMAAGGPMGSPVVENWCNLFSTERKAKAFCEEDYKGFIKWKRILGGYTSGDLDYVEYTIRRREVK